MHGIALYRSKGPSFLWHAIPAYYTRSSACTLFSIAQCTMHNAQVYTILTIVNTYNTDTKNNTITETNTSQFKKGPSCLHAITAYYSRSSACLAIACAILSIAQHTQWLLYFFQFSLFCTVHTFVQ